MKPRKHVLILTIDDNLDDQLLLRRGLKRAGRDIEIVQAESGQQGLEAILSGQYEFNCVFLDYKLPDIDGISFLKSIYNARIDLCPYPIVMLTGQGSEATALDAISYGAQDYLIKDNISTDTLDIAIVKAKQVFDLKLERQSMIRAKMHSEKMDTIGALTSGVAHNFNNVLAAVHANSQMIQELADAQCIDWTMYQSKAALISQAAESGEQLIAKLSSYSRVTENIHQLVDPALVISEVHRLIQTTLPESFQLEIRIDRDIGKVKVDPVQLEHALINLLTNSRDAMPDGGRIVLMVSPAVPEDTDLKNQYPNTEFIRFQVIDAGNGIPQGAIDKVFSPFFTTKDIGKGTGLGLSLAVDFARLSGGELTIDYSSDKGTSMSLFLPSVSMNS
jgi:signal transduction histidine kinase